MLVKKHMCKPIQASQSIVNALLSSRPDEVPWLGAKRVSLANIMQSGMLNRSVEGTLGKSSSRIGLGVSPLVVSGTDHMPVLIHGVSILMPGALCLLCNFGSFVGHLQTVHSFSPSRHLPLYAPAIIGTMVSL